MPRPRKHFQIPTCNEMMFCIYRLHIKFDGGVSESSSSSSSSSFPISSNATRSGVLYLHSPFVSILSVTNTKYFVLHVLDPALAWSNSRSPALNLHFARPLHIVLLGTHSVQTAILAQPTASCTLLVMLSTLNIVTSFPIP